MTASALPKTGLIKQDFKDKRWEAPLNQGFDNWEARVGVSGTVDPVGIAQGYYIGQTFYNSATKVLWYCTVPGSATTTVWTKAALDSTIQNFNDYVTLGDGGIVAPVHHRKVLGCQGGMPETWNIQSGGFSAGWRARIMVWDMVGCAVTLVAAAGQSIISGGNRLSSLAITFPDEGELYTPDGVNFIWTGNRHYTSPSFALNAGAVYDFAHGLGMRPQRVILRLACVVPDLGYVPGDTVYINSDTQAVNYGTIMKATPTTVSARLAVAGIQLLQWDSGITAPATMTSWTGTIRGDVTN